jgi:predicted dehydrogenase
MVGRLAVLPALCRSSTAELVAIGSRELARAEAESAAFGAGRPYASYDAVLADPDVEAVYIPLPNALHHEWTIAALDSRKHVLCEKPLACSAAEAERMADAAARSDRVLMEAYMAGFHPRLQKAVALARAGVLGRVQSLRSVFTFPNRDPLNYRWLPAMGGGALLDVGVYCLDPLLVIAGEPVRVAAARIDAPSGVDTTFSGWLAFEGGVTASFVASFDAPEQQRLEIIGSEAILSFDRSFTAGEHDRTLTLSHRDGRVEQIDAGGCDPYLAMVEHFARVVRGEEASLRPPELSIRTLRVIDRLREAAEKTSG